MVGAGIAGLVAARRLTHDGHDVVVLDKGRRPGGRMATREVEGAVFDHGAQFVTLREPDLEPETRRWRERGWLVEWFTGSPDGPGGQDGHPRYRGAPHQRGLPEALAAELSDVHCSVRLEALVHDGRWRATGRTHDGEPVDLRADGVVVTPPAPQALELLRAGAVALPTDVDAALRAVVYDPCIALLATPDGTPGLPPRGVLRLQEHPLLDVVVDDVAKGVSPVPAVTVHSSASFAREHWDADSDDTGAALADAAADVLGVRLTPVHVHRWRYSTPVAGPDDPAPGGTVPGPVRFAGDGYVGGRVEGAALSGLRAAQRLSADLA